MDKYILGIMSLKKQGADMDNRLVWKKKQDKHRQICKVCGRKHKSDFYVPDEIWEAVVPLEFRNLVVCLDCFDNFAFERNINYAKSLDHVCFSGDQASFSFNVKTID